MTKYDFLEELENKLSGLPRCDIDSSIEYYAEMIDEKIEEGLSEEDAVKSVGTPDEIADAIFAETPLRKIVKEKVKPKRRLTALEIVLIVLGFPLWFPLIIAALAVVFAVVVSLWAGVISLWAVPVSLGASGIGVLVGAVVMFATGHSISGLFMLGVAMLLGGLTIFAHFGCLYTTKGLIWLCKKIFLLIKKCFIGKGKSK